MDNWQDKFLNVTWEEFRKLTYLLGERVGESQLKLDLIVAIARGGLTVAQLLSDQLALPIAAFTVESYKNLKQQQLPHITYGLSASLSHKKILLVDDICDTGKTFLRGLTYLEELEVRREDIKTLALISKPHAQYSPDFFAKSTSAWAIFPYEVRETIAQLVPLWKKDGVPLKEIRSRFLSFKFPGERVKQFVSKNYGIG